MIYGNYVYYHYSQDNFDDKVIKLMKLIKFVSIFKGWGCAYRSLQSVLTWFIEQSFCKEFEIPTHKEIQQMLISMGDKPKEFLGLYKNLINFRKVFLFLIGSNEWIGAFEVNLILSKLLAVIYYYFSESYYILD